MITDSQKNSELIIASALKYTALDGNAIVGSLTLSMILYVHLKTQNIHPFPLSPSVMNPSNLIYLLLHPFPLPSLHLQHNYQSSLVLGLSPIDPVHASSFPLSIHPSIHPSTHLSIHPFISIGMWEVKWTHLMGLCVSRKWLARVSHWLYRWATHCCPRLPWCQKKCHISWEELGKKKLKNTETSISISNLLQIWFIYQYCLYVTSQKTVKKGMVNILTMTNALCWARRYSTCFS